VDPGTRLYAVWPWPLGQGYGRLIGAAAAALASLTSRKPDAPSQLAELRVEVLDPRKALPSFPAGARNQLR
jgi:hypothetical protein